MKALKFVFRSVIAVTFAFLCSSLSCDILDKVDDVSFDVKLTHTFNADEKTDSKGAPVPYSKVETLDATQNTDFNKYKSNIKEITVKSVTYVVSGYKADGKVLFSDGTAKFSALGVNASPFATAALEFKDIQEAATSGTVYTLNIDQTGLNAIATQLKDVSLVQITSSGILSKTPVAFSVLVTVECTAKASPL